MTTVTGFEGLGSAQTAFADLTKATSPGSRELVTGVLVSERVATSAQILASVGAAWILAVALNPPNALPAALAMGSGIVLATGIAYYAALIELGSSASVFDVIRASESLRRQTAKFFDDERPDLKGVISIVLHMLGDGLRSVHDQQTWLTEENINNEDSLLRRNRDALFALIVHRTPNEEYRKT